MFRLSHLSVHYLFTRNLVMLFLIAFVINVSESSAQITPPEIRCITVESSGEITLNWLAPADTGTSFGGYHFFMSNQLNGPYVPIDSVFSFTTFTTTITGVNANTASLYFYIKTREGCCSQYSVPSDTLRSIRMIVTALSNEVVRLNWNRIHNPPLPSTGSAYTLYKELSNGVFSPFKTLIDTTTIDTNIFCNQYINYRVTQSDLSGCSSGSSIDGELFRDVNGPVATFIDTVSIDPLSGLATISWLADSSADTQGYVIYQYNGTSYDSIGSVTGINSLQFTYASSLASNLVETFSVAAYDSCRNLGSLAVNHNTMLLDLSFDKCLATASLEWNAYQNMNGGLQRYEIWYRINNGAWVRDGFVPPGVLTYQKILTQQNDTYEFFVRALGTSAQTASSNLVSVVADIFVQPSFLYIRSASVFGTSVQVNCYVDPAGDVVSYRLYRGNSATGVLSLIDELPFAPIADFSFTDLFADAESARRFYQITAVDSCGGEQVFSNIAGTVLLTADALENLSSSLSWSTYTGWTNDPGTYAIYRVINGVTDAAPFAWVNGDTLTYNDDVSAFPGGDGNLCYVVQAVEDSVNVFGLLDSAFSNQACAPQQAVAYIPNAFTPGGLNPVFVPVTIYDDPETYSLQIFNRWGQLVFSTLNPNQGWDGTFENNDAPTGVYAYLLVFKGFNKKEVRRTGTITLLR
ncbi:MAG: gliding motility-associated C-terminal domain-containing protein [Bacteroidetes bacterium]|nr:gliding motility-associated C-terminal domain-containing protein [Bacteroidota bacterium]